MASSVQIHSLANRNSRQWCSPRLSTPRTPVLATKRNRRSYEEQPRKKRSIAGIRSSNIDVIATPEISTCDETSAVDNSGDLRDHLEHIIVAFDSREKGKLGCAYYIAREERLLCMEDIEHGGAEVIERLKLDIQPTVVLISATVESLINSSILDNRPNNDGIAGATACPALYDTEIRPTPEFAYGSAITKLSQIHAVTNSRSMTDFLVPGDSDFNEAEINVDVLGLTNQKAMVLRLSAFLDLENKVSIGCTGAILNYLRRKRTSEFLPDDPESSLAYRVLYLEMFASKDTMFINMDTLTALQIIQPESHPSSANQGPGTSGAKESLSIYGLFYHHTRTPQGKTRLRQIFLRPSLDTDEINSRLNFVSVFTSPGNEHVIQKLSKSFSKVKNMRNCIVSLHKGIDCGSGNSKGSRSGIWTSLIEFCYHAIEAVDNLREVIGVEHLPLCSRAIDLLDKFQLQQIGKMIIDVVDLELSSEQRRTIIKRGVDESLDKIKDVYNGMDDILSQTAVDIAHSMPPGLNITLNVIYFPQLGFHITVPLDDRTREPVYSGNNQAWERMFTTQNQVYFKNPKMHEMDHELGDLYADICEIEIEITYDLAQRVLTNEQFIITASDICGELDALLALAHGAIEHKLRRPRICEENVIDIIGGRHILQEMTVPLYVPNDTFIEGGNGNGRCDIRESEDSAVHFPSIMILTGPNYSGKSVYQKQVALIVYLAHVGSFVPAETATIGITDQILTRVTTRETVSKHQSSFMIDLQQIAIALNSCTRTSLLVIDEFGKGTDTCDGAGLAAGVFSYLMNLGPECPKVLAATHFHEIFDSRLLQHQDGIFLGHMQVRIEKKSEQGCNNHNSEVIYLYQLRRGRCNNSYGTQCAANNGIPSEIVTRAMDLTEYMVKGEDLVAICSMLTSQEIHELEAAETTARTFLQTDFEVEESLDETMSLLNVMLDSDSEVTTSGVEQG